jgi:hypothetical protein
MENISGFAMENEELQLIKRLDLTLLNSAVNLS